MMSLSVRRSLRPRPFNRRDLLGAGLVGLAGAGLSTCLLPNQAARAQPPGRDLRITKVERVTVKVPYRPVPGRNMDRELPHWRPRVILTPDRRVA